MLPARSARLFRISIGIIENVVRRSVFSLFLLALLPALIVTSGCNRGGHPRQIGRLAPNFSVIDGSRTVSLDSYRGKVVVLNFWASWCAPCIAEIPSLNQLQKKMPQIVVLGISTDEDPAAYAQFLANHPIDYVTIRDGSQQSNHLFGTYRFPETYVIDKQGRIRRKFIGAQNWTTPEILNYLSDLVKGTWGTSRLTPPALPAGMRFAAPRQSCYSNQQCAHSSAG